MSKAARAFSTFVRPVSRAHFLRTHFLTRSQHNILRQGGPINIQPVRFRKPPISYGRIVRLVAQGALTGYLFYLVNEYVLGYDEDDEVVGPETTAPSIAVTVRTIQDGPEGTQAPEAEQVQDLLVQLPDQMPDDAIFIPLWWGKKRPPTFYKGSDPEWQSFLKFAHDTKKTKEVRMALASHIVAMATSNPQWTSFLGEAIQLTRMWLDVDFPLGPPPEYDRPGIEIAEDYVALTSRPQSQENYKRITSALWPEAMTKSLFWSLRLYCSLQYVRLKEFLNLKTDSQDPATQLSPDPFNLQKMTKTPDKQGTQMSTQLDKLDNAKSADSKSSGSSSGDVGRPKVSATGISSDSAKILSYLPSLKKTEGDLGHAVGMFKKTLVQSWQPSAVFDRGALALSGFVEVSGTRARVMVSVLATYHPETDTMKVLHVRPQRAAPRKLAPRG